MSHPSLPAEQKVRQQLTELVDLAHRNVLALAREVGLSNTTFRRNYPEIVKELSEIRRTPLTDVADSPAATEHARLVARNAKLRRANRELREQMGMATAGLARLTLDNHLLKEQLEKALQITRITGR